MASSREASSTPDDWETEADETADDDMDFELASDDITAEDEDEEESALGETTFYYDAEEGTLRDADGDEVSFNIEDEAGSSAAPAAATATQAAQTITITQEQILQLLSTAGIRGIFQNATGTTRRAQARQLTRARAADDDDDELDEDDEDDDDEDTSAYLGYHSRQRRPRRHVEGDRYPPIPSEEGKKLMDSGTFGHNDRCDHSACGVPLDQDTQRRKRKLSRRMLDREMGLENRGRRRALNALASQDLIPGSKADLIINLNARCYSGQFSEDGSFFFACGQDFKVRMYDTSNPYHWKHYNTVNYYGGQWTITDASLSPDNKLLAYSSIRSQICLANTERDDRSEPQLLDFSDMGGGGHGFHGGGAWGRSRGHFGIWSLRFSGDGQEIVAGTSDQSVYVYDLETRRSILRIPGHADDVNAVCFGDKMSPHILYSGSDDTTLKVWDRRSLASMRPAGMFLGHTEGITYIDSKGDGRYVISNAKDQTCKLWDLRKMVSTDQGERIDPRDYTTNFDYRFSPYPTSSHEPHPYDCSLVTFRGHRVLKTLIRCHFSPASSTDGRYIYSGSHDGKIYIWNLDGTEAAPPIDVLESTKGSRRAEDERLVERMEYYGRGGVWKTIVRDCSWHPAAPVIAATSWNGWDHGLGTCTVHSWNGERRESERSEDQRSNQLGGDEGDAEDPSTYRTGAAYASTAGNLGASPMGARVDPELRYDARFYEAAQPAQPRTTRLRDRMRGLGGLWADA